jgi:alkylhydroperoxidase family enzyme
MASATSYNHRPHLDHQPHDTDHQPQDADHQPQDAKLPSETTSYLAPVERPKNPVMRLMYRMTRRQFGMVPRPFSVFCARMPLAFGNFYGKVSKLDKKLELPPDTAALVRAQVNSANACLWCMDAGRWYAINKNPQLLPKVEVLDDYKTSSVFSEGERAALDYAAELTERKHVSPQTFAALSRHFSEREICEIVWLVASEHLYNMSNHGLNIGSDELCEISKRPRSAAPAS